MMKFSAQTFPCQQVSPPLKAMAESKPTRKYTRRAVPTDGKPDPTPSTNPPSTDNTEALMFAEGLFDDEYLIGYYAIKSFLELFHMVKPEDHRRLAQIVEGLVCNPRPKTKPTST